MTYGLTNSKGEFLGVFRSCPLPAEDNPEMLAQGRFLENARQKREYNALPYRPLTPRSSEESKRRYEAWKEQNAVS